MKKCLYVCDDNGIINEKHIVNYETMYFREDVFFNVYYTENHYKTRFCFVL